MCETHSVVLASFLAKLNIYNYTLYWQVYIVSYSKARITLTDWLALFDPGTLPANTIVSTLLGSAFL